MKRRLGVAVLGLAASVGALSACSSEPVGPCLKSHQETYLMPISTGKTTTLVPMVREVCDLRGPVPTEGAS